MPGDLPTFSCIVAFSISSREDGSSSFSFTSTWGILASGDSRTVLRLLKRPWKCSDQRWGMASLPVSRVLPSKERRGAWSDVRAIDGLQCLVKDAYVTHVSILLCPLGKSCRTIILHDPKFSLECTASSLVCSLGGLIIGFCKQTIVAGAFLFRAALGFSHLRHQTSLGVFWSTSQQLQPWFPVVWSSSASIVPQALLLSHNKVFPPTWLGDFHPWVTKFVHLQFFFRLGTFPLGRRLEGKGYFAAYQPMINVAVCTGHHSGV